MAFYNETSLNELNELGINSIGVIKKEGGFDAAYTSRILVIGLGGMGLKTMRRLKKELNDRLGSIDPGFLRILSIDTDRRDREAAIKEGFMTGDEIPLIDNTRVAAALAAQKEFRPAPISSIIPEDFTQALNGNGANQVRLAGRLSVMDLEVFGIIYNAIKESIKGLSDFATTTLDVHVVAGIGGGSGSGLVIDIPYIVRKVAQDLALPNNRLRVFGHVYLPNSYDGIANPQAAYRNGYAALKEIDYYMNLQTSGETFDALYPAPVGQVSFSANIFDQCTLIGGTLAAAKIVSNPQEKALAVCVENLVNQCTSVKGTGSDGTNGSITDFFSAESFHVNTATALNVVMTNPNVHFPEQGNYCYNIIGSSSIKFPTNAIIEKLVGEIGKEATTLLKGNASRLEKKDIDMFEAGIARPIDIVISRAKQLATDLDSHLNDPSVDWTKSNIKSNDHDSALGRIMTNAISAFTQNPHTITNMTAEANRRADLIFRDPKKGPYYLEKLLTDTTGSGGINGYYERLRHYNTDVVDIMNSAQTSLNEKRALRAQLAETMQKFGHFNSNLDEFKALLRDIYIDEFKIRLCTILQQNFYIDPTQGVGCIYGIMTSLNNAYLGAVDIFRKISEIVEENAINAEAKLGDDAVNDTTSIFSLQDPAFTSLKTAVRNTVSNEKTRLGDNAASEYAGALCAAILNDPQKWHLTENCPLGSSKPAAAYREFIKNYKAFAPIVNKKMVDYFEDAYRGQPDAVKTNMIQKLIQSINTNSAPTCNVWQSPHFEFANVSTLCYQYLVLPAGFDGGSDSNGWGSKFKIQFGHNSNTKNIYWSPDQDSIYSYTLYAKMPIWIHEDIIKYEKEYLNLNTSGIHINESLGFAPAMRDYPALMPPSQWFRTRQGTIEYKNEKELEIYENVRELVKFAKRHGILSNNGNNWSVNLIKDKPNVKDGRSRVTIDVFVKKYIENEANVDEKGYIMIDKECRLYKTIMQNFDCEERFIVGRTGIVSTNDDEVIVGILRTQMKLCYDLKNEIEFYKEYFLAPVDREDKIRRRKNIRKDIAKYMLFNLVFAERGTWKYRLGDTTYPIVSKFDVQDTANIAWKADYMEMAVADYISKVENFKEHKALLDARAKTISRNIAEGDDAAWKALEESYAKIKTRCEEIINVVEARHLNGNILTSQENERKEFYSEILSAVNATMRVFSE